MENDPFKLEERGLKFNQLQLDKAQTVGAISRFNRAIDELVQRQQKSTDSNKIREIQTQIDNLRTSIQRLEVRLATLNRQIENIFN